MFVLIGPDDVHLTDYGPYLSFPDDDPVVSVSQNQGDTLDTATIVIRDRLSSFGIQDEYEVYCLDNSGAGAPQTYVPGGTYVLTSTNLLTNGSLEGTLSGNTVPNWTVTPGAFPASTSASVDTTHQLFGSQCYKLTQTNSNNQDTGSIQQSITLPTSGPQVYSLSWYMMGDVAFANAHDPGQCNFGVQYTWYDGTHTAIGSTIQDFGPVAAHLTPDTWGRYSERVIAPGGAVSITIQLVVKAGVFGVSGTINVYFDGVQFEQCLHDADAIFPLVVNPQPSWGPGYGALAYHGVSEGATVSFCDGLEDIGWAGLPATPTSAQPVTSPAIHSYAQKITATNYSGTAPNLMGCAFGGRGKRFDDTVTFGSAVRQTDVEVSDLGVSGADFALVATMQYQVTGALTANARAVLSVVVLDGAGAIKATMFNPANGPAGQGVTSGWQTLTLPFGDASNPPQGTWTAPIAGFAVQAGIQSTDGNPASGTIVIGEFTLALAATQPSDITAQTPQQMGLYPSPFNAGPGSLSTTYGTPGALATLPRLFGGFVRHRKNEYLGGFERRMTLTCIEFGILLEECLITLPLVAMADVAAIAAIFQYGQNSGFLVGVDFTTFVVHIGNVDKMQLQFNTAREALSAIANQTQAAYYLDYFKRLHYKSPLADLAPFNLSDHPDMVTTFPFSPVEFDMDGTTDLTEKVAEGTEQLSGPITQFFSGDGVTTTFYVNGSNATVAYPIAHADSVVIGSTNEPTGALGTDSYGGAKGYTVLYDPNLGKYVFQSAPPHGSANIAITYRLNAPPLVRQTNNTAETAFGRKMAAHTKYNTVTSKQSAIDRAIQETNLYGVALPICDVLLYQANDPTIQSIPQATTIRPGQAIAITFAPEGLVAQYFQIQQITLTARGGEHYIQRELIAGYYRPDLVLMLAQQQADANALGSVNTGDAVLFDIKSQADSWALADAAPSATPHLTGVWGTAAGAGVWGKGGPAYSPAYSGVAPYPGGLADTGVGAEQVSVSINSAAATTVGLSVEDVARGSETPSSVLAWG